MKETSEIPGKWYETNFDSKVNLETFAIQNKEKVITVVHSLRKENKDLVAKNNLLQTEKVICQKATLFDFMIST